jgi:hypothetical protein
MTDDRPASTADSEQRDLADRVIRELLELRAAVYATDVAQQLTFIARELQISDDTPSLESATGVRNARADVWLAVSALATTIKQKPNSPDLDSLWSVAIDAAKAWRQAIGG